MVSKIIIGVDPGKYGALWFLDSKGVPHYCNMPVDASKDVNVLKLRSWLGGFKKNRIIVYLEHPTPRPMQNVKGTATTYFNYGQLLAVVKIMEYEFVEIPPDEWKQGLFGDPKAPKIKGIDLIERVYPDLEWPNNKEKRGGIADAGCIARYGKLVERI